MRSKKVQLKKKTKLKEVYEGLNPQQLMFIEYMMSDRAMNGTNAARQAGYKNASQAANKLMKTPLVAKALSKALHERTLVTGVTKEKVIYELACIAFSNKQDLVDADGNEIPLHLLPDHVARAISNLKISVTVDKKDEDAFPNRIIEVSQWNKLEALNLLAKHVGIDTSQDINLNHGFNFDALWQAANNSSSEDLVERRLENEAKKVENPTIEVPYELADDFNEQGDE